MTKWLGCSSVATPEELLELAMSRKLTFTAVKGTAKAQAEKWLADKLAPKDTLLSVSGVEYHMTQVLTQTAASVQHTSMTDTQSKSCVCQLLCCKHCTAI